MPAALHRSFAKFSVVWRLSRSYQWPYQLKCPPIEVVPAAVAPKASHFEVVCDHRSAVGAPGAGKEKSRELCPLDPLYDRRNRASIILKLLGAVLHRNADALTEIFVVCALVRILKPAPAADVVDKNGLEVGLASFDIPDELLKSVPASKF
jgi:hypothetical protein